MKNFWNNIFKKKNKSLLLFVLALILLNNFNTVKNTNKIDFTITEKEYITKLTPNEVKGYEEQIDFKNKFVRSENLLSSMNSSFQPQSEEYRKSLVNFSLIFVIIGGVITGILLIYLVLRIGFKKCIGPLSLKQINKGYKVSTWILVFGSLIAFIIINGFIVIPSISLG